MTFSLTWMPKVLSEAGLKVSEVPGWTERGRGPMGTLRGVMCHHTATNAPGNMPTLNVLVRGRSDLPGPLSQLGLGKDGTFYIIAAGRANHAGGGNWQGVTAGNSSFIGIEGEHSGLARDMPWPDVQMDAYRRGVAALLRKIGADESWVCGHKEYALPQGRKNDPLFDMLQFRAEVRQIMGGTGVIRPLIPAVDATSGFPTLRRGAQGPEVVELQRRLSIVPDDGIFGPMVEAGVRAFQRMKGLVPDGIVGPKTWSML